MQANSNDSVLGPEPPQDGKAPAKKLKQSAGERASPHLERVTGEKAERVLPREHEDKSGPDVIVYSDSHGSPENSHPGE